MNDSEKLQQKNKQLKESVSRYKEELKEMILYHGESFSRLVCEGVLAEPGDQVPFAASKPQDGAKSNKADILARKRFRYLASLELKQHTASNKDSGCEFISLSDWIENRVRLDQKFHRLTDYSFLFNDTFQGVEDVWYPFFANLAESFGISVTQIASVIYEGVPVYQKSTDGSYNLVPYDDEDYVYLRQKGKHFESVPAYEMPEYVRRFYIKPSHEKWHDIIFMSEFTLSDDEFKERKSALSKQIGVEISTTHIGNSNAIMSETYEKLHQAIEAFPVAYPNHKTKKPKLDLEIRPWLKSFYGLSDRESHVFGSIIAEHFKI